MQQSNARTFPLPQGTPPALWPSPHPHHPPSPWQPLTAFCLSGFETLNVSNKGVPAKHALSPSGFVHAVSHFRPHPCRVIGVSGTPGAPLGCLNASVQGFVCTCASISLECKPRGGTPGSRVTRCLRNSCPFPLPSSAHQESSFSTSMPTLVTV